MIKLIFLVLLFLSVFCVNSADQIIKTINIGLNATKNENSKSVFEILDFKEGYYYFDIDTDFTNFSNYGEHFYEIHYNDSSYMGFSSFFTPGRDQLKVKKWSYPNQVNSPRVGVFWSDKKGKYAIGFRIYWLGHGFRSCFSDDTYTQLICPISTISATLRLHKVTCPDRGGCNMVLCPLDNPDNEQCPGEYCLTHAAVTTGTCVDRLQHCWHVEDTVHYNVDEAFALFRSWLDITCNRCGDHYCGLCYPLGSDGYPTHVCVCPYGPDCQLKSCGFCMSQYCSNVDHGDNVVHDLANKMHSLTCDNCGAKYCSKISHTCGCESTCAQRWTCGVQGCGRQYCRVHAPKQLPHECESKVDGSIVLVCDNCYKNMEEDGSIACPETDNCKLRNCESCKGKFCTLLDASHEGESFMAVSVDGKMMMVCSGCYDYLKDKSEKNEDLCCSYTCCSGSCPCHGSIGQGGIAKPCNSENCPAGSPCCSGEGGGESPPSPGFDINGLPGASPKSTSLSSTFSVNSEAPVLSDVVSLDGELQTTEYKPVTFLADKLEGLKPGNDDWIITIPLSAIPGQELDKEVNVTQLLSSVFPLVRQIFQIMLYLFAFYWWWEIMKGVFV